MPRALLVLCCSALCSAALATPATAAPDPPAFAPPVDAAVDDPFRAPRTAYGPGNRGLEYDTPAGATVRAAADGTVTFAGEVAGSLHVTITHGDDVRTTYSFLARADVVVGQRIHQGDVVGITAGHLHLGARRGDAYFDPATLFERGLPQVRLVPFDDPLGPGTAGERSAIRQLIGRGGLLGDVAGPLGAIGGWLRDGGGQLVRTTAHYAGRFTFPTFFLDASLRLAQAWQRARHASDRPCSAADVQPSPPSERRVALLVAGLGSQSRSASVERLRTDLLGYAGPDVLRFSYAGGRVPDATDAFPAIAARAYEPAETEADLRLAGDRLADLVEAVAAEAPGVPIDLYAHSQGGVVARLALIELEQRHGAGWLRRIGLVATLGSPHGGADLATAVHAATSTMAGDAALGLVSAVADPAVSRDATAVAQLGETSALVAELADHPVPDVVDAVSIAARGDLIVPAPRTAAPGMDEVVVPLAGPAAHSDLPGSAPATRALGLALAGLPPGCQTFRQALLDQGVGEGISLVEDMAGAIGFVFAARADVRTA